MPTIKVHPLFYPPCFFSLYASFILSDALLFPHPLILPYSLFSHAFLLPAFSYLPYSFILQVLLWPHLLLFLIFSNSTALSFPQPLLSVMFSIIPILSYIYYPPSFSFRMLYFSPALSSIHPLLSPKLSICLSSFVPHASYSHPIFYSLPFPTLSCTVR